MKCSQREKLIVQNLQSEFQNETSVVGHPLNANLLHLENYLNLTFSTFYVSVLISWFKQSKDYKADEYQATSFTKSNKIIQICLALSINNSVELIKLRPFDAQSDQAWMTSSNLKRVKLVQKFKILIDDWMSQILMLRVLEAAEFL